MALSERQQRFCLELAKGAEARQAAINAGYKERTASAWARRNLREAAVLREIERLRGGDGGDGGSGGEQNEAAAGEEILRFLTAVMRGEVRDGEAPGEGKLPKVSERTKAAELLGRNQKLFTDKERPAGEVVVKIFGEEDLA